MFFKCVCRSAKVHGHDNVDGDAASVGVLQRNVSSPSIRRFATRRRRPSGRRQRRIREKGIRTIKTIKTLYRSFHNPGFNFNPKIIQFDYTFSKTILKTLSSHIFNRNLKCIIIPTLISYWHLPTELF
jgi:hypothetical protein